MNSAAPIKPAAGAPRARSTWQVAGGQGGEPRATGHGPRVTIGGLVGALVLSPSAVLACPACKDALEGDSVGYALSWTTLMMIAVPMTLFLSIGGWVAFAYWRAARRAANDTATPSLSWPVWAEKESET